MAFPFFCRKHIAKLSERRPYSSQERPNRIYATAFAFNKTPSLVKATLHAGFCGIDTAGALGTYREKLGGDGFRSCINSGLIKRSDIFVRLARFTVEIVLTRWTSSGPIKLAKIHLSFHTIRLLISKLKSSSLLTRP